MATRMPPITGDIWFNSKPLRPEDYHGKIILVDFWTYSCVNCLRTIPHLKEWWLKYKKYNFLIIGVHTPEFEFEKDVKNVDRAIKDLNITWPIVLDNDYAIWRNFANHYWPAKYLIDSKNNIVYEHFGEGEYFATENQIRRLLKLSPISMPKPSPESSLANVCFIPTPETYCGYDRGVIANKENYLAELEHNYRLPKIIPNDSLALSGKFIAKPEYLESIDENSALVLSFFATEVNAVISPIDDNTVIEILLDGKPIDKKIAGKDIDKSNNITIDKARMYNLLTTKVVQNGVITLRAVSGRFRIYAFTFSGCH